MVKKLQILFVPVLVVFCFGCAHHEKQATSSKPHIEDFVIEDQPIPEMEGASTQFSYRELKQNVSRTVRSAGIEFVRDTTYTEKVLLSDRPTLVFFFNELDPGCRGLASVYKALYFQFHDKVKFLAYWENSTRNKFKSERRRYFTCSKYGILELPGIIMYRKTYMGMKKHDVFVNGFTKQTQWRPHYNTLFAWIQSNLIDPVQGFEFKGKNWRIFFNGSYEPLLQEIIRR